MAAIDISCWKFFFGGMPVENALCLWKEVEISGADMQFKSGVAAEIVQSSRQPRFGTRVPIEKGREGR
jgi:hypothetical protein